MPGNHSSANRASLTYLASAWLLAAAAGCASAEQPARPGGRSESIATDVSVSIAGTCVLVADRAWCWAHAIAGAPRRPFRLAEEARAVDVHTTDGHACARTDQGELVCTDWVRSSSYRLALDPTDVVALGNIRGCARRQDRTLRCWALSDLGVRLAGLDESPRRLDATSLTAEGSVGLWIVGAAHEVACTIADRTVRCHPFESWGLGGGRVVFVASEPIAAVAFAATLPAELAGCVTTVSGRIECWGADFCLGGESAPFAKLTLGRVTSGHVTGCATTTSGELWCCLLGNRLAPQRVLVDVVSASAMSAGGCATSRAGLYCWDGAGPYSGLPGDAHELLPGLVDPTTFISPVDP